MCDGSNGGTSSSCSAPTVTNPYTITVTTTGQIVFTPLHKYYISPTGSDSNNGLTPTTAWATPNHPVVCGDVIIAAAGNYNNTQFGDVGGASFGTVSNCPSTSGGIDGTGGIYFAVLLCAGPDLMSCKVHGGAGPAVEVDKSNWAVEGFWATQNTNADRACFGSLGQVTGVMWHHVAFINNIASTCDLAGFDTGNTGLANSGADQTAMIGGIAFNASNSLGPYGVCGSAISVIPQDQNHDAGTHVIVSQNFLYKSTNAPGATQCTVGGTPFPHSDGEGIILDTWGYNYPSQALVKNNVMWQNGNGGFQIFPQGDGVTGDKAKYYILNNTSCCNFTDTLAGGGADMWLHRVYPNPGNGGFYKIQFNIFLTTKTYIGGDTRHWAVTAIVECATGDCTQYNQSVLLVDQNYIWNSFPPTTVGLGGFNTYWNPVWPWGTNTYNDPGLTNPSALPTVLPDCTGYTSTVICMLTKYNVYTNIKPTIAPLNMGYQPPGACQSDPLFPIWLKGVVRLQVSGSQIVMANDLMTKPCGM
jgi:hypothetical protein